MANAVNKVGNQEPVKVALKYENATQSLNTSMICSEYGKRLTGETVEVVFKGTKPPDNTIWDRPRKASFPKKNSFICSTIFETFQKRERR